MANSLLPAQKDEPHSYRWIHIDDFSLGVYDGSFISTAEPIISAPIGAANAEATWCCSSIFGGALGPLPAIAKNSGAPVFAFSPSPAYITGMAANLGLNSGETELIMILEADNGTDHWVQAYSDIVETNSIVNILDSVSATTGTVFGSAFPSWTRMSLQPVEGDASYAVPGPTLVFPSAVLTDPNTTFGHLYVYPNPHAPTVFGNLDLIKNDGTTGNTGPIFTYADRVLVFQGAGDPWPTGGGINTNENIGVTDPPEGYVYPNNFGTDIPNITILSAENPWGYGTWGSISVGEAIFIKDQGGAVVVNGDILAPSSVIPLPGVESIGTIDRPGSADACANGLVYCSNRRGAWVWNGGNTSQKISKQIRDDFFSADTTAPSPPAGGYLFFVKRWQGWALFSNNYFFNTDTNAWWILYPNQSNGDAHTPGRTFSMYAQGRTSNLMYATSNVIPPNNQWWVQFDTDVPAAHYRWQTLPIHVVPTADRVCDVRHVYLRLSSPDGSTTGTCTLTINGTTVGTTPAITSPNPTVYRFNAGLQVTDVIIQLNGDNATGSPPIVHSIDCEYRVRQSEASDN